MAEDIVVTGAAGFIGSFVVERLLDLGHRVVGIDNFLLGSRLNMAKSLVCDQFTFIEADLADALATQEIMEMLCANRTINSVWHMAANSDIGAGVKDPDVDLRNTFLTTYNILTVMKRFKIGRIAFSSSSAVYGNLPIILDEKTGPLFPISNYGAMKLSSEAIISAAVESHLERAWIFRFPNVIGKRSTHGVILDFIRKLRANAKELEVLGDGNQQKNYLHVEDLLDAMFTIIERSEDPLNWFNIGNNDDGATVRFIANSVIEEMALNASIRYTGGSKGWVGDVPKFRYSIEKLSSLGWMPKYNSEEAVRKSIREMLEAN